MTTLARIGADDVFVLAFSFCLCMFCAILCSYVRAPSWQLSNRNVQYPILPLCHVTTPNHAETEKKS